MKLLVQALPLLLVGGIAAHSACNDSSATGDTTTVNVTTEPIHGEACNGGRPDGYCNSLGAVPESCECFDCIDTAYCNGTCQDDGTCGAGEDATCDDCYVPNPTTDNTGAGPSDGGFSSNGGGGAAGSGGAPATTTTTSGGGGGAPPVNGGGGTGG